MVSEMAVNMSKQSILVEALAVREAHESCTIVQTTGHAQALSLGCLDTTPLVA